MSEYIIHKNWTLILAPVLLNKGSRNKKRFFSGPATKALTTLLQIFFSQLISFNIISFYLVARPLPPPLLVAGPLIEELLFFCGFPKATFLYWFRILCAARSWYRGASGWTRADASSPGTALTIPRVSSRFCYSCTKNSLCPYVGRTRKLGWLLSQNTASPQSEIFQF